MTRAYTLLGATPAIRGALGGRVQTPVLGLVVRRDEEIENFVAKDFFDVKAHIVTPQEERFVATWVPSEAGEPYQDEEGRLLHRPLAEHVVKRIEGQPAIVTGYNDKRDSEPAPLPFSLSALQIEAAKRFGFSAQNVLDICQKLYETHKLITYPAFGQPLSAGRALRRPPCGVECDCRPCGGPAAAARSGSGNPQPLLG